MVTGFNHSGFVVRDLERHQLGAAHVCFDVDVLEGLHQRLTARGVELVTSPIYKDTPGGGMTGICYARDPEGNWIELIERQERETP